MIQYQKNKKQSITIKWGWSILILCLVFYVGCLLISAYHAPLRYQGTQVIQINQGDTIAKLYPQMSKLEHLMFRYWIKQHLALIPVLQEGSYTLVGNYSKEDFFAFIAAGPKKENYTRVTLLEGRSMYDIDAGLARKHYITPGDFIDRAQDFTFIQEMQDIYPFLTTFPNLTSLEGFLYPETYFVDDEGDFIRNLIKMQLKEFQSRVRNIHENSLFTSKYSPYQLLTLASIIEAEEKTQSNRAMIAGIFFNRLQIGMRLDADISLCYGLQSTLADCTEAMIRKNLDNSHNPYNTRRVGGFPPTPINNPSLSSIEATLLPQKNNYYYYLHDKNGTIHYGKDADQHQSNINLYLKSKN